MSLKSQLVANTLVGIAGSLEMSRLNRALRHPRIASADTLRTILRYAQNTAYGKEHGFSEILKARNDTELFRLYRAHVPVNDYEALRPWVERHKKGESSVLIPGKPVMYATTSGTTSEPKWIPISAEYLRNVYGKMTRVWLYNFIKYRPKVFSGSILTIVGKVVEGYAEDGTMYGSVSGVTRIDAPSFIKKLYSNPTCVYSISDYTARYYVLMRLAVEQDITLFITPNPSTVVEMMANAEQYFDDYISDIEAGTVSSKFAIEPEILRELYGSLKPNPERARELRALKERHGTPLPRHYWPNLQILSTWKCGNTAIYIDKMEGMFPEGTFHQELGYFSSECRFGLTLDESINTSLFPHFHFYEFVEESELESENPKFLTVDELEEGRRYCPFVTTFSGLYRYNMNDLVEAGPKRLETPTVHMCQKVNGIVSITGEKLHESQFIDAVEQAEKQTGLKTRFFVGFADLKLLGYRFYYEFINKNVTQEQMEHFNNLVDENLKKRNIEYESKRASMRLREPLPYRLVAHSFRRFKMECLKEGFRDGQFKMLLLLQDEYRHAKFKKLIEK